MLLLGFSAVTTALDVSLVKNYSIKGKRDVDASIYSNQPLYIVKKGDTLSNIAYQILKKTRSKFNNKAVMNLVNKIVQYNKISNPDLIVVGNKIDLSILGNKNPSHLAGDNVHPLKLKKSGISSESDASNINKPMFYYSKIVNNELLGSRELSSQSIVKNTTNANIYLRKLNWYKRSKKQNFSKVRTVLLGKTIERQNFFKNTSKQKNSKDVNSNFKFVSNENIIIESSSNKNKNLESPSVSKNTIVAQDESFFSSAYSFQKHNYTSNLGFLSEGNAAKQSNLLKIGGVGNTKKELNVLVKDLVSEADNPNRLPKFKKFRQIIEIPFGSTPLFLQTLESLKIAEESKNIAFSKFLPRVTSSIGGGVKSGGLNNDSSSQSKNLTISQLVYDFGVTSRQYQATEKNEISTRHKIDQQRTDLLLEIINSFFEVYRAKTLLKLSQGFVESRKEFLDSVKVREQIGGSSNADVIRAETKLSEALDRIPIDVQNLKNSEAVFAEYFDQYPKKNIKLHQIPSIKDVIYELIDKNVDKNFKIGDIKNQILAAELNFQAEKRSRYGKFGIQAGYQNTDTNLNTPQEQSSILLTYQIDVFSGFESKAKISQANLKLNALRFELERTRKELIRELRQSENSYEAQSALVLSRVALVKGAELSNQVNRELFELNKTSINDLFRSQEEFLTAAKNLVDATVEKNLSFYRLAAKFGTLLNLFELRS